MGASTTMSDIKTKENVVSVQNEDAGRGCRTRLSQAEQVTQGGQVVTESIFLL